MASSIVVLFFKAAVAILILSLSPLVDASSSSTDREALLSFKAAVTGAPLSWNESSGVCQWSGVFCDSVSGRVSSLDLGGLGLKGSISPNLFNLSSLRYLYLQENDLTGALPVEIGHLRLLQTLNVSSNLIGGNIPRAITDCSMLAVLDLSGNQISGGIPDELGRLKSLQTLQLSQNNLTGPIPVSIGNLSSLTVLDLGTNKLGGPIPKQLSQLRRLKKLQLSINNLTGVVPDALYNISSLNFFALASNNLWGELPSDVGSRLPNLTLFHVCYNGFTGPIPPSLHNITKIQSIRMSHNFLNGTVPPGLGNLRDLTMYNIGFNKITSFGRDGLALITSLTNSTNLAFLAIDGNLLTGVIPDSVGNLSSSLSKFYIGENEIYGGIPDSIARLTGLTLLNMSHNSIDGAIPAAMGQLKGLQMLGLAGNKISGPIPDSLGNLTELTKLELYGNNLEGGIPTTFKNYQQLQSLDLSSNKLNGVIPLEIFSLTSLSSFLNLSKNSLTGPLPEEIGSLKNVVAIDLSHNSLSGNISDSISSCNSLQYLSLSNNDLSGQIPGELGFPKGLRSLDLSSNRLTGSIPDDLAKLEALQFLNLSFNNLEGYVPKGGVFGVPSHVSLEGNANLCDSSSCENHGNQSSRRKIFIIIIILASTLCLFAAILGTFFIVRRRGSRAKVESRADSIAIKGGHPMVSYEELVRATAGFDPRNLIGSGGFGSVYRGVLDDGTVVAVKVINLAARGASKSFAAECEALRNVRHRNLVKIVTLCSSWDSASGEFLALVYEMVVNGSLEDWLRGWRRHEGGEGLSALERLEIAVDVASAVDYLHNDCKDVVVHRDLKPSNVMLGEGVTAKVGDFGLARLLFDNTTGPDSSTQGIKGTIGYIPPEYGFNQKPSVRGDVYSYGILLLELLTGKSPTDEIFARELGLEKWVRAAFPSRMMEVLDQDLLTMDSISYQGRTLSPENLQECLFSMVGVGLSCAAESPETRITMREALHRLNAIKKAILVAGSIDK